MKLHLFPKSAAVLLSAVLLSHANLALSADQAEPVLLVVAASPALHADAQLTEGRVAYARGNFEHAFRIYRNIAVLGVTEAHFMLGVMCRDGQGTRKSPKQAEYWFKHAAKQNHPGAVQALAELGAST